MKKGLYIILAFTGIMNLYSCKDEVEIPGNPVINIQTSPADALFGDSLPFTIKATDADVPLSTLKARLFYGDEMVSETVIRTKVSGQDYTGKIYIPFLKNVPDGTATLVYILQNINFTITTDSLDLKCKRPDYPSLTLVGENGNEYEMKRVAKNQYAVKDDFPAKMNAYIKAPKMGENGNEITFGYNTQNEIIHGSNSYINFSNANGGSYEITFNTLTYEASPFLKILVNGEEMETADANSLKADLTLTKGQTITFDGVPDYENWWIDPDFFKKESDGSLTFIPISGNYRITAHTDKQYFSVEVLDASGEETKLQADGTGVLYLIGGSGTLGTEAIGKPSYVGAPSWDANNPLVMAPIEAKKYQITVVAGKQITIDGVNFKFYGGKGWENEYKSDRISTNSEFLVVNPGPNDDGNIWLKEGVILEYGATYIITVDMTDPNHAVLDMVKTTDGQGVTYPTLNGKDMEITGAGFQTDIHLEQDETLTFAKVDNINNYLADPDYFQETGEGIYKFLPVSGEYRIILNTGKQCLSAIRMTNGEYASLDEEGHGALWLLGWGLGHPSLDSQFGWDLANAYAVAEIAPQVYRFSGYAGPEKNSLPGQRIRTDYLDFKFYKQHAWDTEFKTSQITLEGNLLKLAVPNDKGCANINLNGINLEEGAFYMFTVDLTNGIDKAIIRCEKQ